MQRATPALANPFLSAQFARLVGLFRPDSRVAVLTDTQSAVGFFPFEKRGLGMGVPICGWLSPIQGIVHAPGTEWDMRDVLRRCRLSAWQFDNLITGHRSLDVDNVATVPSPIIDLADGFPAYFAKVQVRSPRFCRELGRKTRKLAREVGELRFVTDSRDLSALRTLMTWKSNQYRQVRQVDRFEQPWLGSLLHELLATRDDDVSGLLSVLYAGDEPVAAQFGLRGDDLLVGWFTGYDPRFRRYSPGLIHLRMLAEHLACSGIREIHMGKGPGEFKDAMKSDIVFVKEGIVTAGSVLGAAHLARNSVSRWAARSVRNHRRIHDLLDTILRRSGIARMTYGRV